MPGSLEREIRDLRAVLFSDRDPDGRGFAPLADALRRAGDLGQALDVVEEGLGRLPDFATGHVVAGWVYRARDQGDEAERAFRKVLGLDEENISALKGLGLLLAERGEDEEALAHFRALDDLDPGDPEVRARLVELGGTSLHSEPHAATEPSDRVVGIEELAPDSEAPDRVVDIEVLAPDAAATAERPAEGTLQVVSIETLAPDAEASGPVVDIEDLAPDGYEPPAQATVEAPEVEVGSDGPSLSTGTPRPVPAPRSDGDADDGGEGEGPWTRTMAELYIRQGHHDRALRIYRRLVEARPDDEDIAARLTELETGGEPTGSAKPEPPTLPSPEVVSEPERAERSETTVAEYLEGLLAWRPPSGPDEVDGA